jgi:hypothetical protein
MSTLMARGMTFLGDALKTGAGVVVSYTRANRTATLTAVAGDQQQQAQPRLTTQAAVIAWSQRDYLILAADFADAGFAGPPQKGDRITESVGGAETVFELLSGPSGEPCWRWSEADRLTYRCHTKRVSG